ncbi:hypothetical protein V1638_04580 [Pseudarthrobacter sp. J64]|uniref:hypothetical protein n=1 Tax=Pseudarthrobacter sp. J64 TaxID=3116485 RepID=UPI002E80A9B8|nr:hypothetical protein [Pseudarthrobacter sp. J64]MEE2568669.1 hypothetical protein [Pseudarthrobacter sp. J64]
MGDNAVQDGEGFYAPLAYGAWWGWAGFAVLLVTAGWLAWVFVATRRRKVTAPAPVRLTPKADAGLLRETYLERMDAVVADTRAGRIPLRSGHQELSLLARKYVRDASGVDAPRMTLDEISRHPVPVLASALEQLYPGEFGPEPLPSIDASAKAAKSVVTLWN